MDIKCYKILTPQELDVENKFETWIHSFSFRIFHVTNVLYNTWLFTVGKVSIHALVTREKPQWMLPTMLNCKWEDFKRIPVRTICMSNVNKLAKKGLPLPPIATDCLTDLLNPALTGWRVDWEQHEVKHFEIGSKARME